MEIFNSKKKSRIQKIFVMTVKYFINNDNITGQIISVDSGPISSLENTRYYKY